MRMEKARWRATTCTCNKFLTTLSHACMCTRMRMCGCDCARAVCRKMCVRQQSVCTPAFAHTVVLTTWVRNTHSYKKQVSSLHNHLEENKFFNSLHVLLVLVIPRSVNGDSLMELSHSPTFATCSRFPEACLQYWISHEPMMDGLSVASGPFEA